MRRIQTATELGVRSGEVEVSELFASYERAGFLYPAKRRLLEGHWDRVADVWARAQSSIDDLMRVFTYHDSVSGYGASATLWRATQRSVFSQHLVGKHAPLGTRATILGAQSHALYTCWVDASETWYRPENRAPARLWGRLRDVVGDRHFAAHRWNYILTPVEGPTRLPKSRRIRLDRLGAGESNAASAAVTELLGPVYAATQLVASDPELAGLNTMYQRVGLRRTRAIWSARRRDSGALAGVAIAHRGPLGLNFSLLENALVLRVATDVPDDMQDEVSDRLWAAACDAYADYELSVIPCLTDAQGAHALGRHGHLPSREYVQSIWSRPAYETVYSHVEELFARVTQRLAQTR